ncbi:MULTISPECIES: hypothetical protein [Comamonadaceae]|uniref:hypothetical protein n=1 Tax=unclassified Acidovorax TaxID=2684926 RepID=UPI00234BD8E4|nr:MULTISPECIES: hypothetical protein [Comamonadaceae]WCM97709.1 hypothetical protein M5C96_25595 [Acidovorax sp. GBBC 1281]WOI46374.1 hypothetical protein R1Z03_03920 [Paracidovorax avenae]GKS83963.1 hypothetical protein AVMA1855_07445 [Acidovorax sp. SUPP1855]GKS89721.1 hypothetical protein AVTE2539_10170 [Acidovorax sp. SUPP2539]GKS94683.1 hypothetical protein AVAK2825_09130 [Acidovorax sp. SUPP2825]
MANFVHIEYRTEHPGVQRAERFAASLKGAAASLDGARGASSLLLAAVVAAVLVVANQVVDTRAEGHMLAAWMVMWVIAFAALALLAGPARRASAVLRSGYKAWAEARRREAEDEKTWNAALYDARIMADLSRAMNGIAVDNIRRYY